MTSIYFLTEDNWLNERRKRVQASEVPALLGQGYSGQSPFTVYMNKVYGVQPNLNPEKMAIGKAMEPSIRSLFEAATHMRVKHREKEIHFADETSKLGATLDGTCTHDEWGVCPVEIKNVGQWNKDEWDEGQTPVKYQIQLQCQMACTGAQAGYLAALLGGQEFKYRFYKRNDRFIELMIMKVSNFWEDHVEAMVPPDPDATPTTRTQMAAMLGETISSAVIIDEQDWVEYQSLSAKIKALTQQKNKLANELCVKMGTHEYATTADRSKCFSWKWQDKKESVIPASRSRVFRMSTKKLPTFVEVTDEEVSEREGISCVSTSNLIRDGQPELQRSAAKAD